MGPLIEIETVPIQIEMKVSHAKLEYINGTADLEINRDRGAMNIKSRPIKVQLDTFEARDSIRPSSNTSSIHQHAQQGQQASYEATAAYARQGELLLEAKLGQELITQFAAETMNKGSNGDFTVGFTPAKGPKIDWDPGDLKIHFEMDKLNFDWHLEKNKFEFTPSDIQISVTQKPDVLIRYVGGPLYVPPSADPNYEPIDVQA